MFCRYPAPGLLVRWVGLWIACFGLLALGEADAASKPKPDTTAAHNTLSNFLDKGPLGLRYPALSPDASKVAFSYQGDLWVASRKGGVAVRITANDRYDYAPRWSPDGKFLLFTSRRFGSDDVFVINLHGGQLRRLTFHSALDRGLAWFPDGKSILFESTRDTRRTLYKLSLQDGRITRLVRGYWNIAHDGDISPQGHHLLFTNSMESLNFWWRKGYKGPNNSDLILLDTKTQKVRQVTQTETNEYWPMWGAKGVSYFYVSGKDGNLWQGFLSPRKPRALTTFSMGPVRWPSINAKKTHIVFERNFRLWITNIQTQSTSLLSIQVQADSSVSFPKWKVQTKVTEFSLSPDGKKLAFVIEGDLFVTDSSARTVIHRVTQSIWRVTQVSWHPNSRELLYLMGHRKNIRLVRHTLFPDKATVLLDSPAWKLFPSWHPKGKGIVYLSGKKMMFLGVKKSKKTKTATKPKKKGEAKTISKAPTTKAKTKTFAVEFEKPVIWLKGEFGGWMSNRFRWSSNGEWLLYKTYNEGRGDIFAFSPKTKQSIRLTPTAANDDDGVFSKDGKFFFYRSNRYGSDWFTKVGDDDLYVLPLKWKAPQFKEDKLEKLFMAPSGKKGKKGKKGQKSQKGKKATKAKKSATAGNKSEPASKPTSKKVAIQKAKSGKKGKRAKKKKTMVITKRDILERTHRLTALKGHDRFPTPSPNGKYLVFLSNTMGRFKLWLGMFKAKTPRLVGVRQIAPGLRGLSGWNSQGLTWNPKSQAVYMLVRGKVMQVAIPSGKARPLRLYAKVQVERAKTYVQGFFEVWRVMRDFFYDPGMSGNDWNQVFARFLPVVQQLQTDADWRDLMNEMLGYLNASHLGVYTRRVRPAYQTGHLGVDFTAEKGHLKISKIWKLGPVYQADPKLKEGWFLTEVNGVGQLNPARLIQALQDTVGKRVTLTLKKKLDSKKSKTLKVRPIGTWPFRWLKYLDWVRERRSLVTKWGKGNIGYLHMRGMGRSDLTRFLRDFPMYAASKKAMIIDIRFNWGGNIHDRILQTLSRRLYSYWQARGMSRWNQPFYGAAHKPMVLLINERSLSDAEMTANGFKALRLGTIVGTPTYRWIIFTSGYSLLQGRSMRVPFWACFSLDGKDLEKTGVTPDVYVQNSFSDRMNNRDPQLKKAVKVLLKQLKEGKK